MRKKKLADMLAVRAIMEVALRGNLCTCPICHQDSVFTDGSWFDGGMRCVYWFHLMEHEEHELLDVAIGELV